MEVNKQSLVIYPLEDISRCSYNTIASTINLCYESIKKKSDFTNTEIHYTVRIIFADVSERIKLEQLMCMG